MVLREDGDGVIAIGQPAHAWVSGQLARAWGNDAFPAPEPREEVCLAAEQHDLGMAACDVAPALNPDTGRPQSFLEMPVATHLELWARAPRLARSQSRYPALLVSLLRPRPLGYYFARQLLTANDPAAVAWFGALWQHPPFQRAMRGGTVFWGCLLLGEFAVRAAMALMLPIVVVLAISGAIEAFVTPSGLPTWLRVGIGVVVEVLFLTYVWVAGGRALRSGQGADLDEQLRGDYLPVSG